jgi:hypothetical protein
MHRPRDGVAHLHQPPHPVTGHLNIHPGADGGLADPELCGQFLLGETRLLAGFADGAFNLTQRTGSAMPHHRPTEASRATTRHAARKVDGAHRYEGRRGKERTSWSNPEGPSRPTQ